MLLDLKNWTLKTWVQTLKKRNITSKVRNILNVMIVKYNNFFKKRKIMKPIWSSRRYLDNFFKLIAWLCKETAFCTALFLSVLPISPAVSCSSSWYWHFWGGYKWRHDEQIPPFSPSLSREVTIKNPLGLGWSTQRIRHDTLQYSMCAHYVEVTKNVWLAKCLIEPRMNLGLIKDESRMNLGWI